MRLSGHAAQPEPKMQSSSVRPHAVATYLGGGDLLSNLHDRETRDRLARGVADLLDLPFIGAAAPSHTDPLFLVPADTLSAEDASALGIHGEDDFWGGAAPLPHVATKAISHGLVVDDAIAPDGWNRRLARTLGDAVLGGFSAFSASDAREAGSS